MPLATELLNAQAARLDRFFAGLAYAPARALLLDYDGTLAAFRIERGLAVPYPGVTKILTDIIAAGRTRVAIVSGRMIRDLIPLLDLDPLPELWGSHGWERQRVGEEAQVFPIDPRVWAGLAVATEWLERQGLGGARLEPKPGSLAFHMRDLDAAQGWAVAQSIRPKLEAIVRESGLEMRPFDGGLELRVPGHDKGNAVEMILSETPPDTAAAYLGDDLTDEDAFRAISGRGLPVLVRAEARETQAQAWLRPPEELLAFLERWRRAAG